MINFLPPFLLGFLALSFQIFLLREFSVHFYGNEITFGFILAAWLLWGGLGSISASKLKFHLSRFPQTYYAVILFLPLCLIGLRFSRFIYKTLPGEITGILPMLISSLVISFFISFPLGILFVLNVFFLKGDLFKVYLLESLGASTAGLAVYFFLIPAFSNWLGVSIVGVSVSLLVFFSFGEKKQIYLLSIILIFLTAFALFDFPSQKIYWKPFFLVRSQDSIYGKLQVIQTEEQISLYNNSFLDYSFPNLAASEESVHFTLLQNPEAKNVLLIGGGAGGSLRQILKYPQVEVDYVELDPEIIRLSLEFLPESEQRILKDKRVHIFYQDGRAFLNKSQNKYDMIILNLPEPATAQINRFYTREFFLEAREKLGEQGIFSFRIPSAENYISFELQNFLASLYYTLKEVFPVVEIVPGNTNIFLASSLPLTIEFEKLCKKIKDLNLQNTYVSPHILISRLNPQRIKLIKEKIYTGKKTINLDFSPIAYFYNSVLWSTQFKGLERKIFTFFSKLHSFWLLDLPLILFLSLLLILWLKQKKSTFFLVPLAVMGFTTIVVEIIMIIAFQTLYGYVYRRIALLLTSFMIGLFLGALRGKKRKRIGLVHLLFIQFGFLLLILLLHIFLEKNTPELFFLIFLLTLGFLGGDMFVVSNHLFLKERKNYGLGYGLDLLGSFFGALAVSSLLIPLVGLPLLLKYLLLLNSFCFIFLFGGMRKL
ncbi:MAG: fused MFS/spermidine synthase [Candidatus Aminicenantes bacterium]|nr:fused MFS/spermidine synthase [Candidatus Aminicenantes bacterium]MBL7082353.1 fused MFS/spermidine synthase [Candidatus Aminicenantes bacterium]